MVSLEEFHDLQLKFSGLADFITVYIAEAHPRERPNFRGNIDISTHRLLEDRVKAASVLQDVMRGDDNTIVVDTMDNLACAAYAALPERLYIVLDDRIVLEVSIVLFTLISYLSAATQGGVGPFGYNLAEIEAYLETFTSG